MKLFLKRCGFLILKTCNVTLLLGILAGVFVLLGVSSVVTWEYTNSSEFCANACHAVHPEEPEAYRDSYHAKVKCVECHMGRISTLKALFVKTTHMKHLWNMVTGQYERPVESQSMRPANESCERCHWPQAFHDKRLRVLEHYERDQESTKVSTRLALRTGGGTAREGRGKGIHWHVENQVRYIAADPQKQQIPWVEVTFQDGTKRTYMDVTHPLTPEQIASSPKRQMDCVDCHNRVGHPFENPEVIVDRVISLGRIDRRLPYAKAWAMRLLSHDYASEEEAFQLVEATREAYRLDYPKFFSAHRDAVAKTENSMKELLLRIKFKDPGVSWQSFPDSTGHTHFPGCFRCHNGRHVSTEGQSIRLHCNICHDIPNVYREGEPPLVFPPLALFEPPSHQEPNFIRDHRFLANDKCARCHIEVEFGSDDTSFCANSACHGKKWPYVELDATAPHPIVLEGKHSQTWCHQCHQGVKRPDPACANCHMQPDSHQFEMSCAACHRPSGWSKSAEAVREQAPNMPHSSMASGACRGCHSQSSDLPLREDHSHYPAQACTLCHTPEAPVSIPHSLEGRQQCHLCHGVTNGPKPLSDRHAGRTDTQCLLCHTAATNPIH